MGNAPTFSDNLWKLQSLDLETKNMFGKILGKFVFRFKNTFFLISQLILHY